jgi:DNA-binding transcriptional LysR family regulator
MVSIESVDLNLLLTLHIVLSEGSVSGAAKRLHVTPSAVSNALARLREILDDPLLIRRGRGLVGTPRAQALAPQLAAAMNTLRAVVETDTAFSPETSTRRFSLASADNISAGALPAVVRLFAQRLPHARLQVVTLDHAVASDGLASGEVDVLLGLPPMTPELRSEPAYRERLVCAVWQDNPDVGDTLSLEQFLALHHVAVVLHGEYAIDYVDIALAKFGRERSIALSVPQFVLAATCIVGTHYVAMLPEAMATQLATMLPLRLLPPPVALPAVTLVQAWHLRTDHDPGSQYFRTVIRDAFKQTLDATSAAPSPTSIHTNTRSPQ